MFDAVDFVDDQDDRLAARAEDVGNFFILRLDTDFAVDNVEDDVGFADGQFSLIPHAGEDMVIRIDKFDAARIDHGKFLAEPFGVEINAVACYAGYVFDDRNALLDDGIEKRRFTDVRAPDDSD